MAKKPQDVDQPMAMDYVQISEPHPDSKSGKVWTQQGNGPQIVFGPPGRDKIVQRGGSGEVTQFASGDEGACNSRCACSVLAAFAAGARTSRAPPSTA
jgi:hypothetical protein